MSDSSAVASKYRGDVPYWFVITWAIAYIFHLAGNPQHLAGSGPVRVGQIIAIALVAAVVISPSTAIFGALVACQMIVFWLKLPVVGNHEMIAALVNVTILLAMLSARGGWFNRGLPSLRWVLLVSYGAIAFSKYNHAFLDPDVSCAVVFADEISRHLGFLVSESATASSVAIYLTIAVESLIPILLLTKRLRLFGVVLGLGFHFALALDPAAHVFDFSSVLFPLFALFLSKGSRAKLESFVRAMFSGLRGWIGGVLIGLVLVELALIAMRIVVLDVAYLVWLIYGLAFGLAVTSVVFDGRSIRAVVNGGSDSAGAFRIGRPASLALAIPVVLAVLNALTPYTELKTAASFNMYSNLAVFDGDSNHLLLPGSVDLRDTTLVQIVETDSEQLSFYVDENLGVPLENALWYLESHPEAASTTIVVEGAAMRLDELARSEPASNTSDGFIGYLQRKLGLVRAVDLQYPRRCLRTWGPAN